MAQDDITFLVGERGHSGHTPKMLRGLLAGDVLLEKEVLERGAFERLIPKEATDGTKKLLGAAVPEGAAQAERCGRRRGERW